RSHASTRGIGRFIAQERAHARVAPDDIGGCGRPPEVTVDDLAQVADLLRIDPYGIGWPAKVHVGRPNESEVILVRNRENDPPVGVLKDIGKPMREQLRYDDVAALDEPHRARGLHWRAVSQELAHPRSGRVSYRSRP